MKYLSVVLVSFLLITSVGCSTIANGETITPSAFVSAEYVSIMPEMVETTEPLETVNIFSPQQILYKYYWVFLILVAWFIPSPFTKIETVKRVRRIKTK